MSPIWLQCNIVNPEAIYAQPTEMDPDTFIHIFEHTYSHILDKEKNVWEEFVESLKEDWKGESDVYILIKVYKNKKF